VEPKQRTPLWIMGTVVALLVGLVGGFLLRPVIDKSTPAATATTATTLPPLSSPPTSPPYRTLPMSVSNNSGSGVILGICQANSDGTQVTASGTFTSPIQGTATIGGAVEAPVVIPVSHAMYLTVLDSRGAQLVTGSADVPTGSTGWSVSVSNQQPGISPAGCVVQLGATQTN
jgi:hypothetical protein